MKSKIWLVALALLTPCGCSSMNNTEKGMLGGAAVGTGAGALLGRGNPAAMAVGGVLGTMVGGVAGANQDQREDRKNFQNAQAAAINAQAQRQMSIDEIVQLSQRGTPDDIIIQQINSTGSVYTLNSSDLIYLQEQRVSGRVISAMQSRTTRTVVVQPRPVVYVQERGPYYPPPPPPPYGFSTGVVITR